MRRPSYGAAHSQRLSEAGSEWRQTKRSHRRVMTAIQEQHTSLLITLSPGSLALAGVVGSRAYGLETPSSDEDLLGVYLADTREVLGLRNQQLTTHTAVSTGPDAALHELGKFTTLALRTNPTITELLWLPTYVACDETGDDLIAGRSAFLSTRSVRDAYLGYATSQADKLTLLRPSTRTAAHPSAVNRITKHVRHSFRLLHSARSLLSTGELNVDVSSIRSQLFELGDLALTAPHRVRDLFEAERNAVAAIESVLPEHPDFDRVEALVRKARLRQLTQN